MIKYYFYIVRPARYPPETPTMKVYRMSKDRFKKFANKWLIATSILMVVIFTIIVITNINTDPQGINILPFLIPFLAAIFCFNIYRSFKRQKKFLDSYSITISDDVVTREQMNTPPLSINTLEIREIVKTKKGSFMIKGVQKADVIQIPYWIEDPASLEEDLQKLAPVTEDQKHTRNAKYRLLLILLAVGMTICFYTIENLTVTFICGPLLIGILVWLIYEVQTNKNVPTNAKRRNWVVIIFILAIVYMMYMRIKGNAY